VEREGALPVSFAQQRLWLLEHLGVAPGLYTLAVPVRLSGHLRVEVLAKSLDAILQRHEALRTTFTRGEQGVPVQVISPEVPLRLVVEALAEEESGAELRRQLAEELRRGFDLERGPLVRVRLWRLGPDEHVLLLAMHHIAADGWSMGVLVKELAAHYEALLDGKPPMLPPLTVQYADYARWQREWLQGEALEAQLDYWRQQLRGALPVLELPVDRSRPPTQTYRGAVHHVLLPPRLVEEAKAFSRHQGASLFMTLLAAFQVLLHRYTRQPDIVVGTPVANRTHSETEQLIGFFVNTLVLRTDVSGAPGFAEVVRRVREVTLDAYAHQDVPFELLVK
ncbi:condensation domain-containing protein, partial [Myxococcus vastator]|uniref:condensation domain-containing protein n=1 Tax=Myxococcus vastator TaxID=2709664 RepID=UPI001F079017